MGDRWFDFKVSLRFLKSWLLLTHIKKNRFSANDVLCLNNSYNYNSLIFVRVE
jgi:hypothetical protein